MTPQDLTYADAGDIHERRITRETVLPLSPDEAFALWASSQGLAQWWLDTTTIELRPGGKYELYFMDDMPPGSRGSDGCRVLSFVPGRMLSFTWNAPPNLDVTRPLHTFVVLFFAPGPGDQGCRVTLEHLGWPKSGLDDASTQWPATFAYFEDAWTRVLDRLHAFSHEAG